MQIPISLILLSLSVIFLITYIILHWSSYVSIKPSQAEGIEKISEDLLPSFSIVIITHDSDSVLERVIDNVANQNYSKFEILVVNNASTDNTNDVIKRAANKYPSLVRHTYLPQNRNGILHMSIATTLGVRASRNEWIVLLKPSSMPKSNLWLRSLANVISKGCSLCIAYNHYYGYDNSKWVRNAVKWRTKSQILNFRAIFRGKKKPIEAESSNIAFRKEDFFANGGYGKWLDIKNFHENLYATIYAKSGKTIFLTSHDSQVETILPPIVELWKTDCNLLTKAYRRFSRNVKLRRKHYSILTAIYFLSVLSLALGVFFTINPLCYDNSSTILDLSLSFVAFDNIPGGIMILALLFTIVSLIHFIVKLYLNHRDTNRLFSPLISTPQDFFEDSYE